MAALPMASPLFARAMDIPTDVSQKNKPVTIKVLLEEKEPSLLLEVKGPYKLFCPHTDVLLSSSSSSKRAKISTDTRGLLWGSLLPGNHALRIVPENNQTTIFVNGIQYKGCVEIYDLGGSLRAINEVGVEDYLKSCLATSFLDIEEPEVLSALAIVLRTQTYYQIEQSPNASWHATASDSGYGGFAITWQNLPLEEAITKTRHAVLTYQNHPFPTCFTENSGGITASFASIFKKNIATPKGVKIQGMEGERLKSAWSFQLAKDQLAKIAKLANVSSMSTFAEKTSGKVYAVKIDNGPEVKTIDFFALQEAVGKSKLKSNDFSVEVLDNAIRFKGYGQGNGVGLCLHTADLMAKQGLDAKAILSKFFEEASLEKMDKLPL
jgi:stage II sporulation protein D